MGKLYVIEIRLYTFDGYPKDYTSYEDENGDPLIDIISNSIEKGLIGFSWYDGGQSRIPQDYNNKSGTIKIVIDVDKWDLPMSYDTFATGTILPSVTKVFRKYSAPYEILRNERNDLVNTYSPLISAGGYSISIGLGVKPITPSPTASTPEETTTTTTTTTTSTTTTTTTLSPGQPVAQETSKGENSDQNNPKSQSDSQKNNITTPGIKNLIQTTIKPQSIEITTPDNDNYSSEFMSGLGYMPIVWYNGIQIDVANIEIMNIYYDGLLPALKLSFVDPVGIMKDKGFPLDDTKITLFIFSRSQQLKSVYVQFKIRSFVNAQGLMIIDGIIDVDGLYYKKFKSYPSSTSNKALQDLCKEIGLGYNTNIVESNDKMTWINSGKKNHEFILDIIDKAYISDESFIAGNIDLFYNLNFVDIQKELSRDINNELGISNQGGLEDVMEIKDKVDISDLFLTNDESFTGSNMFFTNFKIVNSSTTISTEIGYSDNLKYYDTTDKTFLNFKIDSMSNNASNSIVLKGAPQDNNFFEQNVNYIYGGKLDIDNTHKNFNYSETHNNRNIYETQKVSMQVELPTPNYNLYRFQKVKVILSSKTSTPSSSMVNQRLSGDWIVVDIQYSFIDKKILQTISLVKRELELAEDELASELVTNNKVTQGVRGTHDNPSPSSQSFSDTNTTPPKAMSFKKGFLQASDTNDDIFNYIFKYIEGGYTWDCRLDIEAKGLGKVDHKRLPFPDPRYRRPVPTRRDGTPIGGVGYFNNSGETIYGIDRSNNDGGKGHGEDTASFNALWNLIDSYKSKNLSGTNVNFMNCKWEFDPPDSSEVRQMKKYSGNFMYRRYQNYSKMFLKSDEVVFLEKDARLRFHFIYACYNGIGFFKKFAAKFQQHFSQTKDYNSLVTMCLNDRINYGNSLIAQGGANIKNRVYGAV